MENFPKETIGNFVTASRDEIAHLQFIRLRWTLHHAYRHSTMYRKKFDEHGVNPNDFRSLEDLALFPYTTKHDLRDYYPFHSFAVPANRVSRIHASSGTTGKPTVVGYTQGDIDRWAEVVARSIQAAGGKAGDRVHVAYGYGLFTGGLGAHYGAERLGCTVIPVSGGQTERQAQLIQDFQPDILMCTPSYCLNIANAFDQQGVNPRDTSLRIGIFGAEPWTDAMRKRIEKCMNIDAVDIYGLSEIIGPGVAQEFVTTKDGPTIWEDCFYPEIINPDDLSTVGDGKEGELVFTTLVKEAMPIIRYRTRDLTRLSPGVACNMRRMEKITGRSDDMMIIRGVNVFPSQIEDLVLKTSNLSPHYQIEINRIDNLDSLKVIVEVSDDGLNQQKIGQAVSELTKSIKMMIGVSVRVELRQPGQVQRSEGKALRVIDKRKL